MLNYASVAIKLVLGFLCIVVQINLSGKGNLAPINAVDQLQNYILGGIIGAIIYNESITILQFFLVLLIWTIIVLSIRFLTNHVMFFKKTIDGVPITVIKNGEIDVTKLTERNLSANTLIFKLRTAGIEDLTSVKRAILEQNGQLTIVKHGESMLNAPLITDGLVNIDALESINQDTDWLQQQVNQRGFNVTDVYLATYEDDQLVIYPYRQKTRRHTSKKAVQVR